MMSSTSSKLRTLLYHIFFCSLSFLAICWNNHKKKSLLFIVVMLDSSSVEDDFHGKWEQKKKKQHACDETNYTKCYTFTFILKWKWVSIHTYIYTKCLMYFPLQAFEVLEYHNATTSVVIIWLIWAIVTLVLSNFYGISHLYFRFMCTRW